MPASWFELLGQPEIIVFMIPLSVILVGGIVAIVKILIKHRERMALIEHGLHPDYPPEDEDHAEDSPEPPSVLEETQPYVR